jgi:hypothetical protein
MIRRNNLTAISLNYLFPSHQRIEDLLFFDEKATKQSAVVPLKFNTLVNKENATIILTNTAISIQLELMKVD